MKTLTDGSLKQREEYALRGLSPLEVAAYLRVKGWREQPRQQNTSSLWTLPDDGDDFFEVLLPLRSEYRDFVPRMAELMRTLEQAEARSFAEIIEELNTASADIVRVRILGSDATDGSVSLDTNVLLSQRIRDLMLAAACATVAPRAAYHARKPDKAVEYLKGVRAGQTERGSYVLTILSPVAPTLTLELGQVDEPFERQVVRRLITALDAARDAAEVSASTGTFEPFQAAVQQGVSANLCEAIADLAEAGGGEGVEFGCSWSLSRIAPEDVPQRVRVGAGVVPLMREAARVFRETNITDDVEMSGFVRKLDRDENATQGIVIISGYADGKRRTVEVELPEAPYELALQAHNNRVPVVLYGDLQKEKGRYYLRNPRDFHLDDASSE